MTVIDCDSHIMEPADLWQNYLPKAFRDRAIRIEPGPNGGEQLIIGEQVVMPGGLAGLGGVNLPRDEIFGGKYTYADGCPAASYDGKARGALLDEWGVDGCVIFPTVGILPFPTDDMPLINAYCAAYNDWQVDFRADLPGRVAAIAVVNWRDVDAAAAELKRCLDLGFRGLFVPPEVVDEHRPGSPHFDPIWAQLAEVGLPGCLHVIVRFSGSAVPFAGWHSAASMGPVFGFGLGAPGQMIPALTSMVLDGLFERFPSVKVCSVEAGCGWAGYLMDRLDEKHAVLGKLAPQQLSLKPSEYIQRNCYFVAEPEERTIDAMLSIVGEDRILWGSDFPHIDSTLDAPDQIKEAVAGLSPTRQAAVLGENARALFQFDC